MTRKSVKVSSTLRQCSWKATLMKRACNEKDRVLNFSISASNSKRWNELKIKLGIEEDSNLIDYLLTLAETFPQPCSVPDGDDWCSPKKGSQKKSTRGPTLRAVLRRSTRNENENEDKSDEVHSLSSILKSRACKKKIHAKADQKNKLKIEEEEEQKANQLDAELALLVESVALPCPSISNCSESMGLEPYEFQDGTSSKTSTGPSDVSPSADKSRKNMKVGCRRWKSYHKDKRKWKQSYAAVLDDDSSEMRPQEKDSQGNKTTSEEPEKEKRIFKGLKKKRILTAYLDSQNKISTFPEKEPFTSEKSDVPVLIRESEGNSDASSNQEMPKLQCESMIKTDGVTQLPVIEDCKTTSLPSDRAKVSKDVGKENQKEGNLDEPALMDIGDRTKFKKKKKKLSTKEVISDIKECQLREDGGKNSTDTERNHQKHFKTRRKRSLLSEVDKDDHQLKDETANTSKVSHTIEHGLNISLSTVDGKAKGVYCSDNDEIHLDTSDKAKETSGKVMEQSDKVVDEYTEQQSVKTKNCPHCTSRHSQQICPVLFPLQIMEDAITFEQWQLRNQVQVRCSVIESPRAKPSKTRKSSSDFPTSVVNETSDRIPSNSRSEIEDCLLYAEESLPMGLGLQVIEEEHGKSVVARGPIFQYTQFGPLIAPPIKEKDIFDESDMRHIWEVVNGKVVTYVNSDDPQKSNWLRFIRPAPVREKRNVTVAVKDGKLYFITTVDLKTGDELLFWADDHVTSWSRKKILKSSCGGCNMHFLHPLYYRTHCAVFHDPSHSLTIRKYHCKVCGEAVLGKENIMKHAADRHEGRGAYQCQFCHKFFLRLNYLEMHRTYGCASNPHRNRPLCDFCGRYFCQPQKLKVHIKRMHSDMSEVLKEFQCKSCLKILGSRAALQRHFKEVHHRDVVVSSSCDRCGKSFQNRSNLKIHMLTHSGVKPFRCQQDGCTAAFTTKQCLQFHYKKAHGLSEDSLPRIERSIAYTFDAYAGETGDPSKIPVSETRALAKVERKGKKFTLKEQKGPSQQMLVPHGESNQGADIPPPELTAEGHFTEDPSGLHDHMEPGVCQDEMPQINEFCSAIDDTSLSQPNHHSVTAHKAEADTSNGSSSPPPGVLMGLHYSQEDKQSVYSSKTLTPVMTVTPCYPPTPPRCRSRSPRSRSNTPSPGLHSMISLGRRKWLGEAIEVAEEAAAAAMRLSPRLSPRVKRDLYDLDEEKHKKHIYLEDAMRLDMQMEPGLSRANLLTSKPAAALAPFHHPGSASMLVEAALDAAERDICCASSTTKHLAPTTAYRLGMGSPPRVQPVYYTPESEPADASDQPHYPLVHSLAHSPEPHPHPHPLIHSLDGYGVAQPVSPTRMYEAHPHHQILHQGSASSDEEGCVGVESDCNGVDGGAQNLSLNLKNKTDSHVDLPVMYSMPDMAVRGPYQEHVPLPQQSDLNFSAAMTASSPSPTPRYHMYNISGDRQTVDLSMASRSSPAPDYTAYSMDLSLPRSHTPNLMPSYSTPCQPVPVTHLSHPHPHAHAHAHAHPHSHPHPHPGPAYSPAPSPGPPYSPHPAAYQTAPLQRAQISSSSSSPSPGPSGPLYHAYAGYY